MLDDRSYIKRSPMERQPATRILLVVLVAAYAIQSCLEQYAGYPMIERFGLSMHGMKAGYSWQIFTFQFLQQTPMPWHLLFNCLGLYFLGRTLEETLGRAGFLRLYFLSGFFGGLVQLLAAWLLLLLDPSHSEPSVVGASAGVMGLLGACATLFPRRDLASFVFPFPITLRARYLFWFALLLSAVGTLVPFSNLAHAAHLGGILMGVAYICWGRYSQDRLHWRPFRPRQRQRALVKAAPIYLPRWPGTRGKPQEELPPEEFISQEVDPILDKISAHGIQSLTPGEREILEAARAKMEKR